MKERPILMNGEMVRATLDGRKTKTRRFVKFKRSGMQSTEFCSEGFEVFRFDHQYPACQISETLACPYGKPGDRLWVRHDFYKNIAAEDSYNEQIWNPYTKSVYWKVEDNRFENGHPEIADCIPNFECGYWKHTPSIHMPRWASRILLEIVSVRVDRLQDISEEDAEAEGVKRLPATHARGNFWETYFPSGIVNGARCQYFAKDSFKTLWESINGPGSWEKNPWVWVIEFKRVTHDRP